jgi:hypothetical protein
MGLGFALKVFFRVLRDRDMAAQIAPLFRGDMVTTPATAAPAAESPEATVESAPARSDALTLLAALQREARLVDFLKEDLSGYDDAQIGAAVRDLHRDAAAVLERLFALRPLRDQEEGVHVEIPAGFDPALVTLTGQVTGSPPFQGTLVHQGWQATHCALPTWSGQSDDALIITPAEVEVH